MEQPRDIRAVTSSLMFPATAFAAGSAFGLNLASSALGVWMGAVSVAARASGDMLKALPKSVAAKAKPTLIQAMAEDTTSAKDDHQPAAPLSTEARSDDGGLPAVGDTSSVVELNFEAEATPSVLTMHQALPVAHDRAELSVGVSDIAVARAIDDSAVAQEAPAPPEPVSSQPLAIERPDYPDDFKLISGIGPKVHKRLNDLGVWTFAQMAAWSEAEIGWIDKHLALKGRIRRDDWVGQSSRMKVPTQS